MYCMPLLQVSANTRKWIVPLPIAYCPLPTAGQAECAERLNSARPVGLERCVERLRLMEIKEYKQN